MASGKTLGQEFKKGLWTDIHPFRILLGLCPTLAVTNSFVNGLAMGLAALFVLVSATVLVSAFRRLIVSEVRIPVYVVIIASLVTVIDLFMAAMFPPISKALGPYIPLIIVNCMILGRVEAFAAKNPVLPTIMDSLGIGIGFTISLCLMGGLREVLGFGSILGFQILGSWFEPWIIMILPAGAFIVLGGLIALVNYISDKKAAKALKLSAAVKG